MGTNSSRYGQIFKRKPSPESKLDELIAILHTEGTDVEEAARLHEKFRQALNKIPGYYEYCQQQVSDDNTGQPLYFFRKTPGQKTNRTQKYLFGIFRSIVAILIIAFGFAMIILPTPASFEMYTLFYFNENDGFTLMDLISLIVIFAGVYMLLTSLIKKTAAQ